MATSERVLAADAAVRRSGWWAPVLAGGLGVGLGLVWSPPFARAATPEPSTTPPTEARARSSRLGEVRSFAYQLTGLRLAQLAAADVDLLVVDYSRDGSEAQRLTPDDVARLQKRPATGNGEARPRRVLAYLSIGEAESYRYYWRPEWKKPGAAAPSWLGPENPSWPENFKVRYWDPAWQAIVLGYLDRIVDAGFDGVYLDVIDAYEHWGPGGAGAGSRPTADRDMVALVDAIAHHARVERGRPEFAVVPQNGEGLGRYPEYVATVDGIGREDLYFDGDRPQPASEIAAATTRLDVFRAAGRPVLVIDYPKKAQSARQVRARARKAGFVPYVTVRALDRLTPVPVEATR